VLKSLKSPYSVLVVFVNILISQCIFVTRYYGITFSEHLDILCIVETSHESYLSLIACTPPNYKFLKKARPFSPDALVSRGPREGRICVIYKEHFLATSRGTGTYTTFEYLTSYFTFHNQCLLLVVIYRPGSVAVTTTFFSEFADFLAVLTKFSFELLIHGAINIHLDEPNNVNTKKFNRLLSSYAFKQWVTEPTHTCNHTLDIVLTRSHISYVSDLHVAHPELSDHSLLHFNTYNSPPPIIFQTVVRRSFRDFDSAKFQTDLQNSGLYQLSNSPFDGNMGADMLFSLYDSTVESLVNKHAPRRKLVLRKKVESPWFDLDCVILRRATRLLERQFLQDPSN